MKTIIGDDGETYVLKTDMENIIQERLKKVSDKTKQAEEKTMQLQNQLEELQKTSQSSEILTDKVKELQNQLQTQQAKYDRYTKISQFGLYDREMVDLVEWSYDRATNDMDEKKKPSLETWLENAYNNPESSPVTLRPHLERLRQNQNSSQISSLKSEGEQLIENSPDQNNEILQSQTEMQPPRTNAGAKPTPSDSTLSSARFHDLEWYEQNRDRIIHELKSKRR